MLEVFFSKFLYISGHFYITPLLWNLYQTVNLYLAVS